MAEFTYGWGVEFALANSSFTEPREMCSSKAEADECAQKFALGMMELMKRKVATEPGEPEISVSRLMGEIGILGIRPVVLEIPNHDAPLIEPGDVIKLH